MGAVFAKVYSAPDGVSALKNFFRFAVKDIVSFDYSPKFISGSSFSLEFPANKTLVGTIRNNDLIEVDGNWFSVETVAYNHSVMTISGVDLKGLLERRISAAGNDPDLYDSFEGTTAEVIEHFVYRNIGLGADEIRRMPVSFDADGVTGLINDGYMAKLEYLSDIVKTLCYTAGIGFEIVGDPDAAKLKMRLLQGIDRSMLQSARPRVILSPGWGNVQDQSFEHDISNLYNAITAKKPDGTLRVVNRDGVAAAGMSRRECVVDVGSNDNDDADKMALEAVEDNAETHTYKAIPISDSYGVDFRLGDIVTVRDPFTGNSFNAPVTEAHISCSSGEKSVEIGVGGLKPKFLNRIINNLIAGTQKRR